MTWELSDGENVRGPFSDEEVVVGIERGLDGATLIRRSGDIDWSGLRSQPKFAIVLERRTAQAPEAIAASSPTRPRLLLVAAGVLFVSMLGAAIALGRTNSAPPAIAEQPMVTAISVLHGPVGGVAQEPPPESRQSKLDAILSAPNFPFALALTTPEMADAREESSAGALGLAVWSAGHLAWPDVAVTKNETSLALVHKDSDEARGKRMCVGGSLVEIAVDKSRYGNIARGLLMTDSVELVHFLAAGSSGALVKSSPARLCGVVVGTYEYSNSAGGTGHAVEIVGMFDLPENRRK